MFRGNSSSLLEATLPILNREFDEEYARLLNIFKDLITSETENSDFFSSPVEYLKSHNALTFEKVKLDNGEEIPTIQDNILAKTIRNARKLYSEGKLRINEMSSSICYQTKTTSWITKRDSYTESTRDSLVKENTKTTEFSSCQSSESIMCHKEGRNCLEIDGSLIGPLADPELFKTLKNMREIIEQGEKFTNR